MRKESEKKSVTKSIKMTAEQESTINENAKLSDMSFSSYVLNKVIHSDNSLTPEILATVQEIVNCAERAAYKSGNLSEIENIKAEADKLWEYLK